MNSRTVFVKSLQKLNKNNIKKKEEKDIGFMFRLENLSILHSTTSGIILIHKYNNRKRVELLL